MENEMGVVAIENNATESAAIMAGKTAVYAGAATAAVSGMTLSEIGVIVGIAAAVLGMLFGQFWAWRRDSREYREMEARMRHSYGPDWNKAKKK